MTDSGYETVDPMFGPEDQPEPPAVEPALVLKQIQEQESKARSIHRQHYDEWVKNRQAYHNVHDHAGKSDWQAKSHLPKIARDTDFIAQALAEAASDKNESLFTVEPDSEQAEAIAPVWAALLEANLEREGFDEKLEGAIRAGLITSGMAFRVRQTDARWPGYCEIVPLPMERLFRDPTGRGKWLIYVSPWDFADVERMAAEAGWDMEALEQLRGQGSQSDPSDDRAWRIETSELCGVDEGADGYRGTVYLTEYCGPIYGDAGNPTPVIEWGYAVIANRRVVLRHPTPEDRETIGRVIVDGDIVYDPSAVYGKAYLTDARPVAEAQTKLLNITLDQLALNVPALEYDTTIATPDSDRALKTNKGVPAGQVLPKSGPNPLLSPVTLATFHPETLAVAQYLDTQRQEATGATDIIRGTPSDGREQTAREFSGKQSNASANIRGIARGIQRRVIVPLLETLLEKYRASTPFSEPAVLRDAARGFEEAFRALGGETETVDASGQSVSVPLGRHPQLGQLVMALEQARSEPVSVRANGMVDVIARESSMAAVEHVLTVAMSLPGGSALINTPKTLALLARFSGSDTDDLLLDQSEQRWMQAVSQQMAQQYVSQYMQRLQLMDQRLVADCIRATARLREEAEHGSVTADSEALYPLA